MILTKHAKRFGVVGTQDLKNKFFSIYKFHSFSRVKKKVPFNVVLMSSSAPVLMHYCHHVLMSSSPHAFLSSCPPHLMSFCISVLLSFGPFSLLSSCPPLVMSSFPYFKNTLGNKNKRT